MPGSHVRLVARPTDKENHYTVDGDRTLCGAELGRMVWFTSLVTCLDCRRILVEEAR